MEKLSPEVLALVVADGVHRDDVSGKLYILGTRSVISATEFPWTQSKLAAYAVFVEGRGECLLEMRLTDGDEEHEPIAVEEAVLRFTDPLTELDVLIELSDLVFPEPREYYLQLFVDGQFLRDRRLAVGF